MAKLKKLFIAAYKRDYRNTKRIIPKEGSSE